jgi:hypothetical protein
VHKSSKWGQRFFLFLLPPIAQESEKLWGKILYCLITTIFTALTLFIDKDFTKPVVTHPLMKTTYFKPSNPSYSLLVASGAGDN